MPFFFIVSGILYGQRTDCEKAFCLNLGNKIKTMLIPYFVFEIPFALYLCLAEYLAGGFTVDFAARKVFAVVNFTGLQSTWFLPCLLCAQILFYILSKTGKLPCILTVTCLMLFGLLYPSPSGYLPVLLRCFVALGFFAVGFFANRFWDKRQHPVVVAFAAAAYCVFATRNGLVNIVSCTFYSPILYVVNSLLGTFVLLQLSMYLLSIDKETRITSSLEYMGRNSIIVLCTHAFLLKSSGL